MSYCVNNSWPLEPYTSIDECLRRLLTLEAGRNVFHGSHEDWQTLTTSIDLLYPKPTLQVESKLLNDFAGQSAFHLKPAARWHIELHRLIWKSYRTCGTVLVGQHYGLPTRALDWSHDFRMALYIACRREPTKPGVIWWMNVGDFEVHLKPQWPRMYKGKIERIENDFEYDFVNGIEKPVIVPLYFPSEMERVVTQSAFVTIAGKLDVDHAEFISNLGMKLCGRIDIPSASKLELLTWLDKHGVNGYTLGIGDATVETIAQDIKKTVTKQCCSTQGNANQPTQPQLPTVTIFVAGPSTQCPNM